MVSDTVKLRLFEPGDGEAVRELIHSTIQACYAGVYPPRAVEFFLGYHSRAEIASRARAGYTIVAEVGGRVVATGTLKGDHISGVFVLGPVQGRGLGRRVMEALEEHARANGIKEIFLDVSLPSRAFYERMGYGGFEPAFIDVGQGQRLDFWKSRKSLPAK